MILPVSNNLCVSSPKFKAKMHMYNKKFDLQENLFKLILWHVAFIHNTCRFTCKLYISIHHILINYRYWKLTFSFNFLLPNLIGLPDCKIFVRETLLICLVLYIYDRLLHILCQSLFYQLKVNYSRKSVNIFKIRSYNVIIPWPSF